MVLREGWYKFTEVTFEIYSKISRDKTCNYGLIILQYFRKANHCSADFQKEISLERISQQFRSLISSFNLLYTYHVIY